MAITYTDKVQNAVNPLPDEEQWRAVDANEVKSEVNTNITDTAAALAAAAAAQSAADAAQATADAATTVAEVQAIADAKVGDAIVDGVTTVAPSQNAVFDALALKATIAAVDALFTRNAVAVSAGTLTLDIDSKYVKNFDLTATQSGNFTIAFSNTTNFVKSALTLRVTGTVVITMPSAVVMDLFEKSVARWNDTSNTLTIIGVTASPWFIEFYNDGTNIWAHATNRGV